MRFAHVVPAVVAGKGGADFFVLRFAQQSEAQGHQNFLIADDSLRGARAFADLKAMASGEALRQAPDAIFLHSRSSWAFAQEMSRIAPTFAYVHDYAFVCPASIAWFRNTRQNCDLPLGLHCVTNAYSKWCNSRRPLINLQNYREVRQALNGVPHLSGVLVASEFVKQRLIAGEVPASLLHVLPYFSPRGQTQTALESDNESEVEENPRGLLFMGRLNETKGVDTLLESLVLLPGACELVIVGEGYGRAAIEAQIARLEAEGKLAGKTVKLSGFFGFDEAGMRLVEQAYRAAAVVVVPSLWPEPFGLIGLEAFSYGKPVVAFDVGGIRQWMLDGEVGFLAQPDDAQDMADKIGRLLEDAPLRRAMGQRGRQWEQQEFCWARYWERFSQILEKSGVPI